MFKQILKPFASLRLTVVLLALSMVIIFAGTWAQIDHDVWAVQKRYFHCFFTWIHLQLFLPREALPAGSGWKPVVEFLRPLGFPMLGGYSLITLLLINLVAAHSVRFKLTRKRIGIILIHAGLILLILGEVITSLWQVEGQMMINEGQTVNFTQDIRSAELAVIDTSPSDHDEVTVIPASRLVKQGTISYPTLPFDIHVDRYLRNSTIAGPFQARSAGVEHFKPTGVDAPFVIIERTKTTGTSGSEVDNPSAQVTLSRNGAPIGTFVLSTIRLDPNLQVINGPQEVVVGERTYRIQLRWKREYRPYSITLLDFTHDKYTGTETPRNFSSRVRLVDPTRGEDREVLIWMNHPLRYAGETFYQSGFDGPTMTILQVVRNPGWLIPYISCTMVALGMLIHFGAHLMAFLSRSVSSEVPVISAGSKKKAGPRPQQYVLKPRPGIALPLLVTAGCLLYVLAAGRPQKYDSPFDFTTFSRVPLSYEGRVMPLDTLARVSLRVISGKSSFTDNGKKVPAIQWLADTIGRPDKAAAYQVFRIDHPDLKSVLELDPDRKLFSLDEIFKQGQKLDEQYRLAHNLPKNERTLYQKAVHDLAEHVFLFNRIAGVQTLYLAPPLKSGEEWKPFAEAHGTGAGSAENPGTRAFLAMARAYVENQSDTFNAAASGYVSYFKTLMPSISRRVSAEVIFNWFQPFYRCIVLYVLVFLLVCGSWLIAPMRASLLRTAFWVLTLTLGIHTLGLVARIYIQGRPPVTNLYSSAIFIGWAAVLFCVGIERIYRNGIGSLAASIIAFPTLIIAHFLAGSGDTMQMLQAVLDTNFWLATHVVVITLGYAATFLAGIIGCVYVIGALFPFFSQDSGKTLAKITYGIVCFAMLFSFVGTVLGGIWADQSWGRFWGWDPKENGAVLIVLWNAIILHARWGGVVRERGLALLAIFGNIVTAWSWFGTNMLGIGLHSYGFMDSAVFWLGLFIASQLFMIGLGNLPFARGRAITP